MVQAVIPELVGVRALLLLDESHAPHELLGHPPNHVPYHLVQGGVAVGVVEPDPRHRQAELVVGGPQLPVVLLQERDGPGLDPCVQGGAVVCPRAVELVGVGLLVGEELDGRLGAKARGEDQLPTHNACNLLEEAVLRVRLRHKAAVACGVLLLDAFQVGRRLQDLNRRTHVFLQRVQQGGLGVPRLQRHGLLPDLCENLEVVAVLALGVQRLS
mmetsp:Transcript_57387/g.166644  ORF Transcript_57387/g.166644 Transcript_57387/m.166644 type:complete len:214 (-) Transcript_57387:700-1341(-)